ncbi:MAG: hypothetical protein ACE5JF_08640 [Anaerolineales bacterium]
MATPDERLKILKMLEEGKLSAEEASRLLRALSKGSPETSPATPDGESKWMRIRVTDLDGDRAAVNVNLPMRLVNVALRLGSQFIPEEEDIDLEELAEALKAGLTGKIVDVIDEEEGRQVEIYVE